MSVSFLNVCLDGSTEDRALSICLIVVRRLRRHRLLEKLYFLALCVLGRKQTPVLTRRADVKSFSLIVSLISLCFLLINSVNGCYKHHIERFKPRTLS